MIIILLCTETNINSNQLIAVAAPIGNSDHSILLAVISMAQAVQNLCVSRKIFLKHQDNWNTVCGAIRNLPWHNISLVDNPVEVLNEHLSLLVGMYVPTNVIRVRNKDKPWFDDQCRHAFGLKQEAHLRISLHPCRNRSLRQWVSCVTACHCCIAVLLQQVSCVTACHCSTAVLLQQVSCVTACCCCTAVLVQQVSCVTACHCSTAVLVQQVSCVTA